MKLGYYCLVLCLSVLSVVAGGAPAPLPGWQMELVAEAPVVSHPSVVCVAPDGRIFVAEDPMDIRVPAHETEGRILCRQLDGTWTVFAEELHAVFGMQYLEGKLYVLHNPKFTVFNDDNGVGRDRVDLIEQTNPNPWALDWNDHVPANFRLAMDGYFYMAVGDKGVFGMTGRDGARLDLQGGGILRLRPDGTALELVSSGVRNILDVALNPEDEMFTYDNTDEHDWMGRVTHMVEGGFYGYPYDFVPQRGYTLWKMHDLGGGAATGAVCYNEDALPPEYQGNLFLADFGQRQINRLVLERAGATYRVLRHEKLFPNPPEDFRPVGIAWSADGRSLYICDWQHRDVKADARVGRLWKLTHQEASRAAPKPRWHMPAASGRPWEAGYEELIAGLSHPSRDVRLTAQRRLGELLAGNTSAAARAIAERLRRLLADPGAAEPARWHALWALDAGDGGQGARETILFLAEKDPSPAVRRQAIRQLGLRRVPAAVPLLIRLLDREAAEAARNGSENNSSPAARAEAASIRFQAATALGRIGGTNAIPALLEALNESDLFARFALFTALNRIGRENPEAWTAMVDGLLHQDSRVREGVYFALRETWQIELIEALGALVRSHEEGRTFLDEAKQRSVELLATMHSMPSVWKGEWWAYHPALGPPPKRTRLWEGTEAIHQTLREALQDPAWEIRRAAVQALAEIGQQEDARLLRTVYAREADLQVRVALLRAFGILKDSESAHFLTEILREPNALEPLALAAIQAAARLGGAENIRALINLVERGSNHSLQSIKALGELGAREALPVLDRVLSSSDFPLRSGVIEALGSIGGETALRILAAHRPSFSSAERLALARELAKLPAEGAVPLLLELFQSEETRPAALVSLARHADARALEAYLFGLASPNPAMREQSRRALYPIRDAVRSQVEAQAEKLEAGVVQELRLVYRGHAQAEAGALFAKNLEALQAEDYARFALEHAGSAVHGQRVFWDDAGVACSRCHAVAGHGGMAGPDLTLAGAQFSRRELIEHLLYPSRAVREGYQQVILETSEGEELQGLLRAETADAITIIDAQAQLRTIPRSSIRRRRASELSLMPEGLQAGLTLPQFADLIAYLESRKVDPRAPEPMPVEEAFAPLFNGRDLDGWQEVPAGTRRVQGREKTSATKASPHWLAHHGVLEHAGTGGDLWTDREFEDFDLRLEWRWPDAPQWAEFPVINADGLEAGPDGRAATERVLDAGDSGVFVRGWYPAQANLFCYPVGSGEFWEYRTGAAMSPEQRRSFTPKTRADRPIGDWNEMELRLRGSRITVRVNGQEVISGAELPGLPARGPIGLQHEHGRVQFRHLRLREIRP